jgi:hypothetical protein
MKFLEKLFKSKAVPGPTVDAMLVLCVHEPGLTVTPPSGPPLKKLAKDALAKIDPSLCLKEDAYVRFGLLGSGVAPGLPPGSQANMFAQAFGQAGMPADMVRKMHHLAGGKGLSDMEKEAEANLPKEMKKLMQQRNLVPDAYELRSFKESPDPGVIFLWMAAIQK